VTDVDEPAPEEVPQSRRRPRLTRLAPEIQGAEREALSLWMKEQLQLVEDEHRQRVELLRHGREHPCPIFETIVRNHGVFGTPKTVLAKLLGIPHSTLMTHYSDQYDMAAAETMAKIAGNMVRKALSTTDPDAARVGMSLLEKRGGAEYRPAARRVELEDTTKKDVPIIDSSKLTADEREQLKVMLERIGAESENREDSEQES
jgi:hypothetical protein